MTTVRIFWNFAARPLVTVAAIFISGLLGAGCQKEEVKPPPPPVVEVTQVVQKDVPIYSQWVGVLDGYVNAVIRAQVTGYLIRQDYTEGQQVRKGQVLFEIDPRTFKATLDQAKGQLAEQRARWTTAKANLARIRPLAQRNAVSRKDLDDAVGMEASIHAAVEAAQAAVEEARLNLDFTRITSPVDGIAGLAKAQLGNLVGPNATSELTTVSTVNPIKAYINISEQEYLKVNSSGQNPEKIPLDLILADGSVYPYKGRLALSDRQIDPTTGTLKVGAVFPNPNNTLRPGGYGQVRAVMSVKKGALLVPQRAVTEMQGKYLVAVVGPLNKVDIRPVQIGERIGSEWIITSGLKPGDTIVVEGTQKVKPGMTVNPRPVTPEQAAGQAATVPQPRPVAPPPPAGPQATPAAQSGTRTAPQAAPAPQQPNPAAPQAAPAPRQSNPADLLTTPRSQGKPAAAPPQTR